MAKLDDKDMMINLHFNGKVYKVDILSFNATEVAHFREKFGKNLMGGMKDFDLDTAAQILYMWLRKENPRTKYEEVAKHFTYRDLLKTKQDTKMIDDDKEVSANGEIVDIKETDSDDKGTVNFTPGIR